MTLTWRALIAAAVIVACATTARPLHGQDGIFVTAGRMLGGTPEEATWRVTVQRDLVGPIGVDAAFMMLPGARPAEGELYGVGADLTLFSGAHGLPTVLVGAAAGIGFGGQERLWAGGSLGLRMPVIVLGPVRLMAEGRWRHLSIEGRDGVEVGVAFGFRKAQRAADRLRPESAGLWVPPPTADLLKAGGIPEEKARLIGNVVREALEQMGQPYVWGGTGDGNGGFDCSGLIYYAYRRYGIALPRTAQSQATAGIAIRRDRDALLPGDILTFGERGELASHVGLYVGDGKFIHSAAKGVRLSRLDDQDPEGRDWLKRWLGVRRVVE